MKTIDPTLAAMQKNPNAQAIARASLADNGRLHLAEQFTHSYGGGYTGAANCAPTSGAAFIVRIRSVPAGTKVQYQKITDPTVESQWETWNDLDTNLSTPLAIALFWTGTYVVALYQDAGDFNIKYRRSTDGTTWSAESQAYAVGAALRMWGADGGSLQSGVFVTHGSQLYWGAYNPAADTWTALSSAALSMTSSTAVGDAFYDSTNSRHVCIWAPNGLFSFSRFGLVVTTRTTGGTWAHHRVLLQSDNLGCRSISVSKAQINGYWWLSFERQTAWVADNHWLSCSDDGLFWEAPQRTAQPAEGHTNFIGELTGYTGIWVASESRTCLSTPQTYWTHRDLVRYSFTAGATTARVAGGRPPHLTVVVDNRGGLAVPELYSVLTLERGFRIAGIGYYVSAGVYYVVGFRYLLDGNLLELQCIDTLGLLSTFVSDVSYNFTSHSLQNQIEAICALAGAHSVSFDSTALWSDVLDAFTHPANENARSSLDSLRERSAFDYFVEEDGTLSFYVPTASPVSGYTYGRGSGEHIYWPGEFGSEEQPNFVRVVGHLPRTVGGDDADDAAIAAAGRQRTFFVLDRRVKSESNADELAAAWLIVFREWSRAGFFEAPPNFVLEVGDVIDFAGSAYEATAGAWRVEQIQELFNPPNTKKFVQRIHLRGVT